MLKCDILNSETLTYEDSGHTQEQILSALSYYNIDADILSNTQSYEIIDCIYQSSSYQSGSAYRVYK